MHEIIFYRDKNGKEPVLEYITKLTNSSSKDSRIKANRILAYIDYLRKMGKQIREPYAKHLEGEIWELRPIRDRILFAAWDGKSFILLHYFVKQTQKTPQREIDKAKRELADMRTRSISNEQ